MAEAGPIPDLLALTIVVQTLHGLRAAAEAGWFPVGPSPRRILLAGPTPEALRRDPLRDPGVRLIDLGVEAARISPSETEPTRIASDLRTLGELASALLDRHGPRSAGTAALIRRLTWSRAGEPTLDAALDLARDAAMTEWERTWFGRRQEPETGRRRDRRVLDRPMPAPVDATETGRRRDAREDEDAPETLDPVGQDTRRSSLARPLLFALASASVLAWLLTLTLL